MLAAGSGRLKLVSAEEAAVHVPHGEAQRILVDEMAAFCAAVEAMDDDALLRPSRCRGWSAADLVVHVHLGLVELMVGVHSPAPAATSGPDTDAATYWRRPLPSTDSATDSIDVVRFVQRMALAYRRPAGLVAHFLVTAGGARRAAGSLADGLLAFQGHVMTTGDFLAMWAVELALHHLDLTAGRPPAVAPEADALALIRRTADALMGAPLPPDWPDERVALLAAGRELPTPAEAARLADPAALPLIG